MKNINRAVIAGNLTRDAELRRAQSGLAIMEICVAVNDSRKDPSTGEWTEYPNYIDCVLMGERAEKIASYLTKGTRVAVEGRLRQSRWEKDGQKRSKIEIIIDQIEFMSRKGETPKPEPEYDASVYDEGYADSDIPF